MGPGQGSGTPLPQGAPGDVLSVAFSPDGKHLASASGHSRALGELPPGEVKVWDANKGQELFSLKHRFYVGSVAFSPDGTRLASSGPRPGQSLRIESGEVIVWDARTAQELVTLKGKTSV